MKRQQIVDLYFLEARSKLIDLAAFLDRADRAEGEDDFRLRALRQAIKILSERKPARAQRVLLALSDPTTAPSAKAAMQGACGAYPGKN